MWSENEGAKWNVKCMRERERERERKRESGMDCC